MSHFKAKSDKKRPELFNFLMGTQIKKNPARMKKRYFQWRFSQNFGLRQEHISKFSQIDINKF